jgi:arylamine N-acetyltransferase
MVGSMLTAPWPAVTDVPPTANLCSVDPHLRTAYLARLGLQAEAPSVHALRRLHRAQVERVPYETMWIHAGESWTIDVAGSVQRIALEGRGGYCFHLNGAFGALLESLGYAVERHVGGVHGPGGPSEADLTNHLVLTVRDLPTGEHPDGTWYVDAGLGDALHEPVPLRAGPVEQGPFRMTVDPTPGDVGDWHLTHDPLGSFAGMSWRSAPATLTEFEARHEWLSTSADSGFVRVATAQRRDAAGVDVLRGLVLTRVEDGARPIAELTDRDDWFAALAEVFGLRFEHTAPDALDALWERTLAGHRSWDAAGRP